MVIFFLTYTNGLVIISPLFGKGPPFSHDRGKPVDDVQVSFGLLSLSQVGEATSGHWGKFWKDLPVGEYAAAPFKKGYVFEPESITFLLSPEGYRMEFKAFKTASAP